MKTHLNDFSDNVEIMACAAHMANRAYCIALGDLSQPLWENVPMWMQVSVCNGVEGVLRGDTPKASHEGWLEEKKATGWKYGPVKDPEKKEHPCFVPYDELPQEQKLKDDIFVTTVKSLMIATHC